MLTFRQKITRLCGVAAMALALSSAAYAADITVKHAQGETAVPASPERSWSSIWQASTILTVSASR